MLKKDVKNAIFDVHFFYPHIWTPTQKYQTMHNPEKPFENKEYVISILIDKEDRKELKRRYKTVASVSNIKDYTEEEFKKAFKVDPPYEAEEYYIWKLTLHASYKDGSDNERRVTLKTMGCDLEGKQFSNGTKGHVQWRERKLPGNKLNCDLHAVCVTEPVFYENDPFSDAETVDTGNVSAEDINRYNEEGSEQENEQGSYDFSGEDSVENPFVDTPKVSGEDVPF